MEQKENSSPNRPTVRLLDKQYVWRINILYQVPGVCF